MSNGPVYRVEYERAALRDLKKLTIDVVVEIVMDIGALRTDRFPPNSEPLKGEGNLRRLRTGDYRSIYSIDDDNNVVVIARVRHRREVYRD